MNAKQQNPANHTFESPYGVESKKGGEECGRLGPPPVRDCPLSLLQGLWCTRACKKAIEGAVRKLCGLRILKYILSFFQEKFLLVGRLQKYRFYAGVKRNTIKMILLNNYILKY